MEEDRNILDIVGTTAILNGSSGTDDTSNELLLYLQDHGKRVYLLDNLYEDPEKLSILVEKGVDTLYIFTTAIHRDKLEKLAFKFRSLRHIPKHVIFYSEGSLMPFLSLARELKKEGTQFWYIYLDEYEQILEKIEWI